MKSLDSAVAVTMGNALQTDFNPDFASPVDWAAMYRFYGLQVIPSYLPGEIEGTYKRPLVKWADIQDAIVPALTFERWYGTNGDHRQRSNMGILTGRCSGNVFVIDLDTHTHPEAGEWWLGLLAVHNNRLPIETPTQKTGGGGFQMLFRAPPEWRAPTNKTAIGVDIRGQGGFAVMPPSQHEKKTEYAWLAGLEPWWKPVADAPDWLLRGVEEVVRVYGGGSATGMVAIGHREVSGTVVINEWGRLTDMREDKMFRMVFAVVVKWHRETKGVLPFPYDWDAKSDAEYLIYERIVEPMISVPGKSKTEKLEIEGRGPTKWRDKFRRCMKQWDTKIAEAAAQPPPKELESTPSVDFEEAAEKAKATGDTFERLYVPQIKNLPDPRWLVLGLIIEHALGFIYGPPGCLKTFIALDMGLTFATGRPQWWGREVEHGGAVVYISSEGQGDLKFRIKAWELHRKQQADTSPFCLIRQSINFLKADDVGKLLATVQAVADETKASIAAVFVDTVSRVLPGSDENLQKDMTIFVAACDAVRQKFGATVIGVHHTARAGNMRGSTVIPAAGDFVVEVRREPGAAHGSIFAAKVKAGEDGWEQQFKTISVQLGDIGGHSSLVVDTDSGTPEVKTGNGWPEKDVLRQILAAISEQWFKKQPWCFSKNSPRAAVTNISKRWRIKRKIVEDILAEWTAKEVVVHDTCDARNHIDGYRKLIDI